jgi:hypothetical protein
MVAISFLRPEAWLRCRKVCSSHFREKSEAKADEQMEKESEHEWHIGYWHQHGFADRIKLLR